MVRKAIKGKRLSDFSCFEWPPKQKHSPRPHVSLFHPQNSETGCSQLYTLVADEVTTSPSLSPLLAYSMKIAKKAFFFALFKPDDAAEKLHLIIQMRSSQRWRGKGQTTTFGEACTAFIIYFISSARRRKNIQSQFFL